MDFSVSGNQNNGTIVDNTSPTSNGQYFGSFDFDGDGDKIDMGSFTELDGLSEFTVSQWVYALDIPFTRFTGIFARGSNGQRTPWVFSNNIGGSLFYQIEF